jgi:hypothetical protein
MARRKIEGQALPKLAFRVEELVYSLGLGETKIRELIDKGQLGCIREGTAVLVTLEQATTYLKRKQAASGWMPVRIPG